MNGTTSDGITVYARTHLDDGEYIKEYDNDPQRLVKCVLNKC
jgi:hypothetical protein